MKKKFWKFRGNLRAPAGPPLKISRLLDPPEGPTGFNDGAREGAISRSVSRYSHDVPEYRRQLGPRWMWSCAQGALTSSRRNAVALYLRSR
jgi:hypothetical protein